MTPPWNKAPKDAPTVSQKQMILEAVSSALPKALKTALQGFQGQTIQYDGQRSGRNGARAGNSQQQKPPAAGNWERPVKKRWKCKWASCKSGMNKPDNTECYACSRPKEVALSPPPSLKRKEPQDQHQPPADPKPIANGGEAPSALTPEQKEERRLKRKQRKMDIRKQKREAREVAEPKDAATPPPAPDGSNEEVMVVDGDELTPPLPELAKDEVKLLQVLGIAPAIKPKTVSTMFTYPPKVKDTPASPEDQVATACGNDTQVTQAQANVVMIQSQIEQFEKDPLTADLLAGPLRPKLKEWQEKVEALTKKKPSTKPSLASLQAMRSNEQPKEDERSQTWTKNAETAQTRYERLKGVVLKQQEILAARLTMLEVAYTEATQSWHDVNQKAAKAHQAKLAAWDARISTAEAEQGGALVQMQPPDSAEAPTANSQAYRDHHKTVQWNAAQLPAVPQEIDEDTTHSLSRIMANVRAWHCNGTPPVTFARMADGTGSRPDAIVPSFREIVGAQIWTSFFGDRVVTTETLFPVQLANVVREALDRVRDMLDKGKDAKVNTEQATEAFNELYERSLAKCQNAFSAY